MAIKLKSDFSKVIIKLIAIVLFGLFIFSSVNVILFYKYLSLDSYYKSDEFVAKVDELANDIVEYYITYDDYGNKTIDDKVNKKSLDNLKQYYKIIIYRNNQKIKDKYAVKLKKAKKLQDSTLIKSLKMAEKKEIHKVEKEFSRTDYQLKKELTRSKDQEYKRLSNKMNQWKILKYYIKNKSTGSVYSNIGSNEGINDYLKKNSEYSIKIPVKVTAKDYNRFSRYENVMRTFQENNLVGYFIVPKHVDGYNNYSSENIRFLYTRKRIIEQALLGIVFFVISIALEMLLSANRREEKSALENVEALYMHIPIEIRATFLLGASLFYLYIVTNCAYGIMYEYLGHNIIYIIITIGYSFFMLVNLKELYFILRDIEILKSQCSKSIIGRVIELTRNAVNYKNVSLNTFLAVAANLLVVISISTFFYGTNKILMLLSAIYLPSYFIVMPIVIFKRGMYLNKILEASKKMMQGDIGYAIDEKKGDRMIRELAHNINNIGEGYKKSLSEQMKSERMKSELITNVSHDLKTPLTSIINYVDLLKSGRLSGEEVEGYISVISRKSERLKVLIEDLFEAAKITSGAVELNIEKLNVTALLKQALAEFDEKIEKSSLTFRTNIPAGNIYLDLDGKKTWRVFENMINNILKYSQPDTRVYIELMELDESVKIIMKNIANYEMDFDVDEIFERFKRGDKSRHTEGTGLGLAIAKSILEMEKGRLSISVDGDLFKATVEFKK